MRVLLDLIYLIVLVLASPWLLYRIVAKGEGRGFAGRLGLARGSQLTESIWLHGSSAGEVSLLKPVVACLERDLPGMPIVVSAYTSTGLAIARAAFSAHTVVPFPFDFSFVVARMLRRFDPALVVVMESEFWPNFLRALAVRRVPVVLFNGKMSAKSHALHARTGLLRSVLSNFSLIAVQREEHAERFRSLGAPSERIVVTGNMKYDLAGGGTAAAGRGPLRRRLAYRDADVVVIGGSLHPGEDDTLLDAFGGIAPSRPAVALVLVPRYPSDAERVEARAAARGYRSVRLTSLDAGRAEPPGPGGVLVVDTVGQLGQLYAAADVAFVGGSLYYRGANKGGHNLMEPAVLRLPVLFGPYNVSFKETVEALCAEDAGWVVRDVGELAAALERLCDDVEARTAMGERARRVILERQGATQRNYGLIDTLLERKGAQLQPPSQPRTMPPASSDPGSP